MRRSIAIVVRTDASDRIAEALRAAVGLTLRGDAITVVFGDAAKRHAGEAKIARALGTLEMLGHTIARGDALIPRIIADADAIEVWS